MLVRMISIILSLFLSLFNNFKIENTNLKYNFNISFLFLIYIKI